MTGGHRTAHWISTNGRARLMSTTLIPELEDSGESPKILVLTRDITEEKETEPRLRELQRMSAVAHSLDGFPLLCSPKRVLTRDQLMNDNTTDCNSINRSIDIRNHVSELH